MANNSIQTNLQQEKTTSLESIDWTFPKADTQYLTHGLHPYPARMIPQIPDALINFFYQKNIVKQGGTLFDPFSGSGTSAVEARLHNLNAEACDVNPLACMLSKAKAIPLKGSMLKEVQNELLQEVSKGIQEYEKGKVNVERPAVREGWFPEPGLQHLVIIRNCIDRIEEERGENIARFFRVVLSRITRQVSYQRNGEFKRYRIPEEKRHSHNPDVLNLFKDRSRKNVKLMTEFYNRVDPSLETLIHYEDSRIAKSVEDESADVVITSPPYGDHRTTVAYGQFSQDSAIICGGHGYNEMKMVDKRGLGGAAGRLKSIPELGELSPSLSKTLDVLRTKDGRAEDALDFFTDYYEVLKQLKRVLKPEKYACLVVGNRTMSRVQIPTHLITKEFGEALGFNHFKTLPREIPSKTMPWENAPENIAGKRGELMAKENTVIIQKPG